MAEYYLCCFCGQKIQRNPGRLIYTPCLQLDSADQYHQDLFCHASCLTKRLDSSVKMYVLDLLDLPREPQVPAEPCSQPVSRRRWSSCEFIARFLSKFFK